MAERAEGPRGKRQEDQRTSLQSVEGLPATREHLHLSAPTKHGPAGFGS